MDSWTQLRVDDHLGPILRGNHIPGARTLPGLLGAHKAGAEPGVLVLFDPHHDLSFDVRSEGALGSIHASDRVPNHDRWPRLVGGGSSCP